MFITIKDASKGKPYTLEDPFDNSGGKLTIGIKSIFIWIGWFNIYEEEKRLDGGQTREESLNR